MLLSTDTPLHISLYNTTSHSWHFNITIKLTFIINNLISICLHQSVQVQKEPQKKMSYENITKNDFSQHHKIKP